MSIFFPNQNEKDALPQVTSTPEEELELIEVCSLEASKYLLTDGRIANLFNPELIYNWIQNETIDQLTNEPIKTVGHACDYAIALSHQYADEDFQNRMKKKRLDNNRRQKEFQDRQKIKNANLYAARLKYKESIEQRKQVIEQWNQHLLEHEKLMVQWDAYVAQCKLEYNVVKAKRGVSNDN